MVVVAAVFVGTKLWHTVFGSGDDYAGGGKRDIVIQVQDGDSTTAVGETLQTRAWWPTVRAFVNASHGNERDFVDPARLLPDAHRDPGR